MRFQNLNFTYKILNVLILTMTAFPIIGGMQIVSFYVINCKKILTIKI